MLAASCQSVENPLLTFELFLKENDDDRFEGLYVSQISFGRGEESFTTKVADQCIVEEKREKKEDVLLVTFEDGSKIKLKRVEDPKKPLKITLPELGEFSCNRVDW